MYPAKIGRARGWSKQHVAYYVGKLEKAGLIRRLKRSSFVDYSLTDRDQNFLVSFEGVLFGSGVPENIECSLQVSKDLRMLVSDFTLLKRILTNLVNNALQSMPDGGRLEVTALQKERLNW